MSFSLLQLIVEQLRFVTKALLDSEGEPPEAMRRYENHRYRARWDDVRDFLAVHYKYNHQSDSPFWQHARAETSLGDAQEFVDYVRGAELVIHNAPFDIGFLDAELKRLDIDSLETVCSVTDTLVNYDLL